MPRKKLTLLLAAALGLCFVLSGCYGHYGYYGYGHRYYDDPYWPGSNMARRHNSYDYQYRDHHRVKPPKREKKGYPGYIHHKPQGDQIGYPGYHKPRREIIYPVQRPAPRPKPGIKAGGQAGSPNESRRPSALDREGLQSGPKQQPQLNKSSRPRDTQMRRQAAPANTRIERSRPRLRPR